jgi:CheY-like chemotaxis protein
MRRTILLADDSVTIRKIVELTFGGTNLRVESVGSGREALERLKDLRPDLALLDVVMPGPTGYDVCRAIKASPRPVPVLLLAGTFEPFDAALARECGSDGHVTKPFDARQLVERVETLLAAGSAPKPAPQPPSDDLEAMFNDLAAQKRSEPAVAAVEDPSGPAPRAADDGISLSAAEIDAIARRVVERLSDRVLREIAWDVVPDLANVIVRQRIRELERDPGSSS